MNTKTLILAGTATVVLFAGSLVGASVIKTVSAEDANLKSGGNHFEIFARVSEILGISQEDFSNAIKTASTEKVDEKLSAGEITEEQANEYKTKIAESEWGMPFMGKHKKGFPAEALANFLGVDEQEIKTKISEGMSPAEIIEESGKSHDEFHQFMKENRPAKNL